MTWLSIMKCTMKTRLVFHFSFKHLLTDEYDTFIINNYYFSYQIIAIMHLSFQVEIQCFQIMMKLPANQRTGRIFWLALLCLIGHMENHPKDINPKDLQGSKSCCNSFKRFREIVKYVDLNVDLRNICHILSRKIDYKMNILSNRSLNLFLYLLSWYDWKEWN